jgi:hypothetical protein
MALFEGTEASSTFWLYANVWEEHSTSIFRVETLARRENITWRNNPEENLNDLNYIYIAKKTYLIQAL